MLALNYNWNEVTGDINIVSTNTVITIIQILYQITKLVLPFLNYYSYSLLYSCFTHVWWFCLVWFGFVVVSHGWFTGHWELRFSMVIHQDFSSKNKSLDSASDGIAKQDVKNVSIMSLPKKDHPNAFLTCTHSFWEYAQISRYVIV